MVILEPVLRRPGLHHVVVSITNGEDPVSLPLFVVHA